MFNYVHRTCQSLQQLITSDICRFKNYIIETAGYVVRVKEVRNALAILTGKHREKIPLGRPRLRWKDNIRIDLIKTAVSMRN